MRSKSLRTSFLMAAIFIGGFGAGVITQPIWKLGVIRINQNEFGRLTFKCDQAMRNHLIAKQEVVKAPSDRSVRAVEAAEIGLLDCQDYDLKRKQLARWGVSESEISEMSLVAVEERANSLIDVVKIHEIRY